MLAPRLSDHRQLLRVQGVDARALRLAAEGRAHVLFHSGRGQEAVPVGATAALGPGDLLLYGHRGLGWLVARGMDPVRIFGDLLANVAGATGGLGAGIVHSTDESLGILGQSGTVGGNLVLAAGAALAAQRLGRDQVVLCVFGDGGANRGTFHEAANAAGVWQLPVVWLCENNGYGMSVPLARSTAVTSIAARAAGYGMPGVAVDGQDVDAVRAAVSTAVDRARSGGGPTLVECRTLRFRGHFEGDPDHYRDRAELEEQRQRDPVLLHRAALVQAGVVTGEELDGLAAEVDAELDAAVTDALAAPLPGLDRLPLGWGAEVGR